MRRLKFGTTVSVSCTHVMDTERKERSSGETEDFDPNAKAEERRI